ncbi:unnamed protein product [Cylindrotheca closterium]|uniref:Uncharacterized protein n=1 Tax=Cylindrotheca closterium TaxID=2856 RepID=A0AAD2FW76_9STRA|nr:unnamed protein product [Cylindrotheca closterium]
MPGFKPDGGSEEDTAAMEEEKNKTEKKKGSFGMLWEATLLADFQEFVSKILFAHYSAPESKLSNQQIKSQTCPSKLPPQVSQEGLRNYIHSHLNDNLDPSFQTEDNGESVNFEHDDDHEEELAELSIESEARNNPNGSFVMDLDVGSQYGANYLPNDITLPTINFEVDDPHVTGPNGENIPLPHPINPFKFRPDPQDKPDLVETTVTILVDKRNIQQLSRPRATPFLFYLMDLPQRWPDKSVVIK